MAISSDVLVLSQVVTVSAQPSSSAAVAVPLAALFDRRTGRLKFADRDELAKAFLFEKTAKIVVSGVDADQSIERYWGMGRSSGLVEQLLRLNPDLVTTPNFSLFNDVPREDNLQNMKRIAICWSELACAGIPTAVHLNGRTDTDWDNWIAFLKEHVEIDAVAIEFGTGLRSPVRAVWYVQQLERLRNQVGRDVALVVRGNRFVDRLSKAFPRIIAIDTGIYMKSVKRQVASADGPKRRWRQSMTFFDQPIDDMLQANADNSSVTRSFNSMPAGQN